MDDLLFDKPPAVDGSLLFGDDGAAAPGVPYEPNAALVFRDAPATSAEIVFDLDPGEDGGTAEDVPVRVVLVLPGPAVAVHVALAIPVRVSVALAPPAVAVVVRYASNTQRPLVGQAAVRFQDALPQFERTAERWQNASHQPIDTRARWQDGLRRRDATGVLWRDAIRRGREGLAVRYQQGLGVRTGARTTWRDAKRFGREGVVGRFQNGLPISLSTSFRFQDGIRNRGEAYVGRYQDAVPLGFRVVTHARNGLPLERGWATRYQDAKQPIPGITHLGPRPPEPPDPCYVPDPALVFQYPASDFTQGQLVFYCDRHDDGPGPQPGDTVVVPVRRIYTVINSATLTRVAGGALIPTFSMSLSLDVESWTWSFNAAVPGTALADLEPDEDGTGVEVEAVINGAPYRFLIEQISRERAFASNTLRISGRGLMALLDAPYAPVLSFGNDDGRTAQQLMADVLTINGVPLDWSVDWQIEDWFVPGGLWRKQGSYIEALNEIVSAAGGYLQPTSASRGMKALLRYPAKPWEWGDVVPDFELPADVVTRESTDWAEKARYDRVFVSGVQGGVLGDVIRAGTSGEIEAPMVTDTLITNAVAARQRGVSILANTGRIATYGLRLPVLAETGVIPPGKFVRYVDSGVSRLGITRSVSVEVGMPAIWQTIGVEVHESL